jgi:hypothetical protein
MSLVEYIYVDNQRVDSYFEQITSVKTKLPAISLKLTWPFGEVDLSPGSSKEKSEHEKIEAIINFLQKEKDLGAGRPFSTAAADRYSSAVLKVQTFQLETFNAWKLLIPIPNSEGQKATGITFWLSQQPKQLLLLLESYTQPDQDPTKTTISQSEFSMLFQMLQPADNSKDLIQSLKQCGVKVMSRDRKIRSLYRVREIIGTGTIFGYPIFIEAL